jgi:succinoglycan biosynthesis protein ExoA
VSVHRHVEMSTLTPVLNEERHIRDTVAALQAQDLAGETEFIFIDGRSTDRTRAILEELAGRDGRIGVLDNPARHTAAGLNIGLRAARGEYVARIDAHARYPPSYLSRGVDRLRQGDVDWVSGPQVPVGTEVWSRRIALALGTSFATGGSHRWPADAAHHSGGEVELETGVFAGVWRRTTLERHGGWDEGWPINQDSELAARMLEHGRRIVSMPELAAEYAPRASLGELSRQYRRYGMYRAKTAWRHPWTVRPRHVALPGLIFAAAAALAGPRPLRRAGRRVVGVYAVAVAGQSARTAVEPGDVIALPAVFVTMHGSWGAGFLLGLVVFARPSRRRPGLATDLTARAGDEQ